MPLRPARRGPMRSILIALLGLLLLTGATLTSGAPAVAADAVADPALAAAIREQLHLAAGSALGAGELGQLRELHATGRGIRSLAGLEQAANLRSLVLDQNDIEDLSPLAGLRRLQDLALGANPVRDITALAGLTELVSLNLWQCQIEDIEALRGLVHLRDLSLQINRIRDLSALAEAARKGALPAGATLRLWSNPLDRSEGSPTEAALRFLAERGVTLLLQGEEPAGGGEDPAYADDDLLPPSGLTAPGAGPNPPAASRPTLVRVATDGSLLLFGGHSGGDITGEFWRYWPKTGRWEPVTATGGPVRGAHSAVWDPDHQEMIVFGGVDNLEEDSADLYLYSPSKNRWRRIQGSGKTPWPRARKDHTAVWDPQGHQMLVFGGHASPPSADGVAVTNDLWAWRPAEQRLVELAPAGQLPGRRHGHAAAWDPTGRRLLIFGGWDIMSEFRFNDLWSYDPAANAWTQLDGNDPNSGDRKPSPRERMRAVWDTQRGRMVLFGGCCGPAVVLNDFWAYDPARGTWQRLVSDGARPTARELYAAAWDPEQAELILYGGWGQCWPLGDLWAYRPADDRWRQLDIRPSGVLPALEGHTAVWDEAGDQMLVFGGCDNSRKQSELYAYRPATDTFVHLAPAGDAPRPRSLQQAAWDPVRRQMLVFGGYGLQNTLNDLWAYDIARNRWQRLTEAGAGAPVEERYYGAAVWDPVREQMILIGGRNHAEIPATVWAYRPATRKWVSLGEAPTGGRDWQRAVWDAGRGWLLAFGGWTVDAPDAGRWPAKHWQYDLWSFDPGSGRWEQLPSDPPVAAGPSGRYGDEMLHRFHRLPQSAAAVWEPVHQQMLLFGGFTHQFDAADNWQAYSANTHQLWAYSPAAGTWTLQQPAGALPPGRTRTAAVWDSRRGRLLAFGGFNSDLGVLSDLWSYDPAANRWTELHPKLVETPPGARAIQLTVGAATASLDDSPATLEVAPYIREGRTLVPVRFIAEALGLQVGWDGATQTVTLAGQIASADGSQLVPLTVLITVGQRTATVNGQPRQLEVAAEITGGRTFLPLRFVAEAFGLQVDWDPATRGIGLRR